jgi:prepilin signal peptidase PulO-like enzyme (type II secretory pathway)
LSHDQPVGSNATPEPTRRDASQPNSDGVDRSILEQIDAPESTRETGPNREDEPHGEDVRDQPDATALRRPRRRWRWDRDWPIWSLLGAITAGWVVVALLLPPLEIRQKIATSRWKFSPSDPEVSISVRMMLRTCEYWFLFWFFYLGASIGSFINVVASRTPQGKTIVTRGSHCPYCDTALSMIDNSPLFGWVLLRGRCRSCRLPISPRYVIMEIIVGLIFMALAIIELISNGANLPYRDWNFGTGIVSTVFYPKWDLIGAYAVHCSVFAVAVMLIGSQSEALRFPARPLAIIGLLYLACVTFNRVLCPVRWTEPLGAGFPRYQSVWSEQCLTAILGALVGIGVGWGMVLCLGRWIARGVKTESTGAELPAEPWPQPTASEVSHVPHSPALSNSPLSASSAVIASELLDGRDADSHGADSTVASIHSRDALGAWRFHCVALAMLAGTLFGWQACLTVGVVSTILTLVVLALRCEHRWSWLAVSPERRRQVLALAIWTMTLFLHLCLWRQVAHWLQIG